MCAVTGGVLCVDADCDSGDSDADTLPLPVAPTVLTSHSMPPAQEKSLNNISKDEVFLITMFSVICVVAVKLRL